MEQKGDNILRDMIKWTEKNGIAKKGTEFLHPNRACLFLSFKQFRLLTLLSGKKQNKKIENGDMKHIPRHRLLVSALASICRRMELSVFKKQDSKIIASLMALQSAPGVGKSFTLFLIASMGRLDRAGLKRLIDFGQRNDCIPSFSSAQTLEKKAPSIFNSAGLTITFNFGLETRSLESTETLDEYIGWRFLFS